MTILGFFRRPAPKRLVFLESHDGYRLWLAEAHPSGAGCGWVAACDDLVRHWCILNADGTVTGSCKVGRWHPHAGWDKDEE
jgi:hypothetical protein